MFLEKVFIRANPVEATSPSVDLAVYFESLCPDSIRSGWDFVISSCDLQFWFSSFDLHLGLCKTQVCQPRCSLCLETFWPRSQDLIQAIWQSFGKWNLRKSAFQQQSCVDLLTSIIFTFRLFVCLSPWWHLHLSPSNDVLDHTNLIFWKLMTMTETNTYKMTNTKTKTHTHRQIQIQSASKTQCMLYFSKAAGSRI